MKKTLRKIFLISVISFPSLMYGEYLKAQEGLEFVVLATQNPGEAGARVFRLKDGDPLESGGGFRIKLKPQQKGKLQVTFDSGQGKTITLGKSLNIEKGAELILPDKNKWYTLDRNTGSETIVFEIEDVEGTKAINKFRIQHIDPLGIVNIDIKDLAQNQEFAIKNKEVEQVSARRLKSISLRGASKLLDKINSANFERDVIQTRGVGNRIYRQYSAAVVFLSTEDEGTGSGFILKNGDIITNWHVIKGYQRVSVYLKSPFEIENPSEEVLIADVVEYNTVKDLALLKVVDFSYKHHSVELGESKDIEIGAEVHAIGHPEGGMRWSYSKGNISGYWNYEWELDSGVKFNQHVIQMQAPINPGNSGGPLFNNYGKLIGIVSSGREDKQLINFAVAVDEIRTFLKKPQQEYRNNKQKEAIVMTTEDLNNDGIADVKNLDTDGNGVPDKFYHDENFDGTFEYVILDGNENQIFDGYGYDTDSDGLINWYRLDLDEDGKIELYGFDDNQDGEIDRYSKR